MVNRAQIEMLTTAIHRYGSISYRLGSLKNQGSRFLKLWKDRNETMQRIRDYMDAEKDIQEVMRDERTKTK